MSGGGGNSTTTQKADPWSGQQPYLQDIFANAQQQFQAEGPNYFPGSTVTPYAPQEVQAQQQLQQYAQGGAQQQADQAQGAQSFLSGPVLYPGSNPALGASIRGAISPIAEQLTENILPGLDRGAVISGGYGGSRHGVMQSQLVDKALEDMLATSAGMASEGYGQGLEALTKGLALAPQTMQLGAGPAGLLAQTGQMDREMSNALLQDQMARHQFEQSLPATKLAQYQQLVQGNFGGQSVATSSGGGQSKLASGLGGAMSGAAGGAMVGAQIGSVGGPMGAVIGGGLGLLMGIL